MKLRLLFLFFFVTLGLPAFAAAQTNFIVGATSGSTTTATTTQRSPRPVCIITANPGAVYVGQSVTLRWDSRYATGGTITAVGSVGPSGAQGVIPTASANTFSGTFTGPGGTGTCAVQVSILQGNGGGFGGGTGGGNGGTDGVLAPIQIRTGAGLIPCSGTDCQACHLAGLAQNIINWLVGISIPLAAAMFAYAGVIYFTAGSGGMLGKIESAHKIFKNVGIGFVIVITAWLGIQTILKTVLAPGFYSSWNTIQCVRNDLRPMNKSISEFVGLLPGLNTSVQPTTYSNYNSLYSAGTVECESGSTWNQGALNCEACSGTGADRTCEITAPRSVTINSNANIGDRAATYYGTDTSSGPGDGRTACAWAVNNILRSEGIAPIDENLVANMESQLNGGRGTPVLPSDAQRGDIVVWKTDEVSHVGICYNANCSEVVSNSSNNHSFNNISGQVFQGVQGRIYRVNR